MKKIISSISLCMALYVSAQTPSGIQFSDASFQAVLKQAKKEHKLVLVDCYTSWCGPCKWMDANVFSNDTVGAFFNEHFVSVRLDMEKGEGKIIKKNYDIHCYPTYLFLDGTGDIIHRTSGAYSVSQYISVAQIALDATQGYGAYEQKYASGNMSANDFIQYIRLRDETCLRSDSLIRIYEQSFAEQELTSANAWLLLHTVIQKQDSRLFTYLCSHRTAFDTKYSPDSVDQIVERIYLGALYRSMGSEVRDTAGYMAMRKRVAEVDMPIVDKILQKADVEWYLLIEDWERFVPAVMQFMKAYGSTVDLSSTNNYAWIVYENTTDMEKLKTALVWARQSVSIYPHWFNTDTYATLLYATGNLTEARVWAQIAIMLAKEKGIEYGETQKLLNAIEGR